MLPKSHQEKLKRWMDLLLDLRFQLDKSPDLAIGKSWDCQSIEIMFKQEILSLSNDIIDSSLHPIWQSFQTESHRCLRLLSTNMLFLTSSKSEATRLERLAQIKNLLDLMISYCQNLLSSPIDKP